MAEQQGRLLTVEEVQQILKEATEETLIGQTYHHTSVSQWTKEIMDTCIRNLTALKKPYKYIVSCTILQKKGTGFHSASSCYWDSSTDASHSYRFENKTLHCMTTVFAVGVPFE
ncbi:Dynein light chain Tctex-type [Balamuthia mandrillaris]